MNNILRLTAITIFLQRLWHRPKRQVTTRHADELSPEELARLNGTSGDVMLERMGTFDFAPGAVDEMMKIIEDTFEQEPASDQ